MFSRSFSHYIGCLLLVVNSNVYAESDKNSSVNSINLKTAISKTFQHNPELRSFRHQLTAHAGRELQQSFSASPELSFSLENVAGTGELQGSANAQANLGISWVLEGDIRQGYIDVSKAGRLSLNTEQNIMRLDAAADTAKLYLNCMAHQARMTNTEKTVELANETVLAVKKRVSAGKAPEAELARAKAELSRRLLEQEDVHHELSSAIRLLAAQWGQTRPDFSRVEGDIFSLPTSLPFETLKTNIEQSPAFLRLLSNKRLKQAQLKLAQSKSTSAWSVNLGVRHAESSGDQALLAGITIPFGERSRNTGEIMQAQEHVAQITTKEHELRVRFETMLYVLSQELGHSLHRFDTYRNDIIPQLETALKQTRRAYMLGRYSYLEWNSVQAELLDSRSSLLEASIDAHLKGIEIQRLTGLLAKKSAEHK